MNGRAFSVGLVLAATACMASDGLQETRAPCAADSECAAGNLCLLGECRNPRAENLGRVDLLVSPLPATGLRPKAFTGIDPRRGEVQSLVLSPTYSATLRACHKCDVSPYGVIPGTLTLTAPERIPGIRQIESVVVDMSGMAQLGLLADTPYEPVLVPADTTAPLLRGLQVFVSALSGTAPVNVTLPDPMDIYQLSGSVFLDTTASQPLPAAGMHVYAVQGNSRLTRDARVDNTGAFQLPILRSAASGVSVVIEPAQWSDVLPSLTVTDINLDADHVLSPISLGLTSEMVPMSGRVIGPNGDGVAAARVRLTAAVGTGTLDVSVLTDHSGQYDVSIPPGTYARAVIPPSGSGAALAQQETLLVGGADGGVSSTADVALGRLVSLCGVVRDDQSQGVANAVMFALRIGNVDGVPGPASDVETQASSASDESGGYCMAVDTGRYLISAVPPEASRRPGRTDQVDVGTDSPWHEFLLPPAALVTGTVHGPDGTPLRLARVRAYSPDLVTAKGAILLGETITADNGAFTITAPDLVADVLNLQGR
jgi:hypothetical protein